MVKNEQQLIEALKEELNEDRYNGDWDDGEHWIEAALDCPSNTSEELQEQLVDLVGDKRYEEIMKTIILPYMRKLRDGEDE